MVIDRVNAGRFWEKSGILIKLFGIVPFQGIIYNDTFTAPIFVLLTIIEYVSNISWSGILIYGDFGLIALYLLAIIISKAVWIINFISKIEKNRYISSVLKPGK